MVIFKKQSRIYYVLIGCTFLLFFSSILQTHVAATTTWSYSNSPTGYETWSEITLQMDYEWKMWSATNGNDFEMWMPRLSNHSHPYVTGVAPLQYVQITSNSTNIVPSSYYYDPIDENNNSVEYFSDTLNTGTEFVYNISYTITTNETTWDLKEENEGEYNLTDPFYTRLTKVENNIEVNFPSLVSLSNSICSGKTTVISKFEAILDWVIDNIEYTEETASKGAYQTYVDESGDCSDFSTILVTLLRIQGIPARKILGMALIDEEGYAALDLEVGDEFSYSLDSLPGHAWVEFYVPGYGFITMDPTWAQMNKDYRDYIDHIHIVSAIGENSLAGIEPALPQSFTEFGLTPIISSSSAIQYELTINIEVLDADIKNPRNSISFHTGTFIIVGLVVISSIGISLKLKRRK